MLVFQMSCSICIGGQPATVVLVAGHHRRGEEC